MKFMCILLIGVFGSVLSSTSIGRDEEHEHLHELAKTIMHSLQKDHMPSENSQSGAPNAPLQHFHNIGKNAMNSEDIEKSDKTKISVGVKGIKTVSVEKNGKVVNISAVFGVGAVAVYNVNKKEYNSIEEEEKYNSYSSEEDIDNTLELMKRDFNFYARPDETKITLSQKAKFSLDVKPKNLDKPEVTVKVDQGYVVMIKVKVNKGYNQV